MGKDRSKTEEKIDEKAKEMDKQAQEAKGKLRLARELAEQTYDFGLLLNFKATWQASLALPWGLSAAGAAATRTFVDAGDPEGAETVQLLMELKDMSPVE